MYANGEATMNAQSKERTMAEHDTQSQQDTKKKRNTMKDKAQKISQLRELVKAGRTREQICMEMGVNPKGFETLRRKLIDMDKTYYDIPHEVADRNGRVGKTGILVSSDRLVAMGAESIFPAGTAISILYDGDEIRIQRADRKNLHSGPQGGSFPMSFEDDLAAAFEAKAGSEFEGA